MVKHATWYLENGYMKPDKTKAMAETAEDLREKLRPNAVSLVKAGVAMEGTPAGAVRPPLVMPTADDLIELQAIIAAGRAVLAEALTEAV